MEKFTCIMCPVGCSLIVEKIGDQIKVEGNGCIRGQRYGISEVTNPTRVVTALIKTQNGIVSVKTTAPVPKNMVLDVVKKIQSLSPKTAKYGEILIKNVLELDDVDVIVTRGI